MGIESQDLLPQFDRVVDAAFFKIDHAETIFYLDHVDGELGILGSSLKPDPQILAAMAAELVLGLAGLLALWASDHERRVARNGSGSAVDGPPEKDVAASSTQNKPLDGLA